MKHYIEPELEVLEIDVPEIMDDEDEFEIFGFSGITGVDGAEIQFHLDFGNDESIGLHIGR